ncbi:RagB/SusD family nutrient uptake outer membrane protein [Polluticaenibacter yanchengensis]|uniref:RagB/SusD family nutrient uptake outer membrane protein n=1 Tax=Polluticaenibacter yanchengensis TaxID=3014562 RepID=A0ABT4UKS7_9BACT|nr:RagB/SusD family nutrient uptake outer membrane protein [Chitinophagaceae bacterium LY-5]
MNIKNITIGIFTLLLAGGISSCSKFLEEPVDNRTLITTLPDMEKTLNTLLPYSDHHFTDIMSDDYIFRDLSGHIVASAAEAILPIFEFSITRESISESQFLISGFNPVTAFRRYYYRIINSYLLIDKANAYVPKNEEEVARKNVIIGKALATKAYCYYMLTNLFAKQYNASTAASDKSVPFIEAYNGDAIVPYSQASVAKVYESIEADLLKALSLLNDTEPQNAMFTMSKDATLALLTRVYLDKKNWDEVIKYSNQLLSSRTAVLNVKQLRGSITDYAEYSNQYFNPANASNILMGNNTYQLIAYFWSGMYPYPALQFMRTNNADPQNNYIIQTSALFSDYVPQKFGKFFNTSTRNFNLPLLTVDEVYFNRAEANIEKNNGINQSAINDLSVLIDNQNFTSAEATRKKGLLAGLTTRATALDMLLTVKRIRFSSEGMRWFDMRRHNIPVEHVGRSGTYSIDGTKPEAYVIKLPLEEITRNTGIE